MMADRYRGDPEARGPGQAGPAGPGRPSVSALLDDQRARFRRGEPALVEDYLAEHSGLASDGEAVLDLIYNEIVLREQRGDAPRLDDYRRRFPHLADPVSDLFEVHQALRPPPASDPSSLGESGRPIDAAAVAGSAWPALSGYEIVDVLGCGGMGVVYRAHDRRRGADVALKTMQRVDAGSLYRFKQEFRSLLDVSHRNLVNLYELVSDGRGWFITMELIDGVDFLRYVRSALAPAQGAREDGPAVDLDATTLDPDRPGAEPAEPGTSAGVGDESRPARVTAASPLPPECRRRLREALRQLAEGVAALHVAGKLHRDIKPSNVLVTREGRVVLMDFGLATERDREGVGRSGDGQVVGTAAYMAPEQAAGLAVAPASDWYSVGVMLYQALTGRLPFVGEALAVLMDKQRFEPPPPGELVSEVPEDLEALCVELLRRDPRARPSGAEVLRRLGSAPAEPDLGSASGSSSGSETMLIGRGRHRRALAEAFEAARAGRTVVLDVHGRSGVGKSALVRHALDALERREAAVVLAGRCYERESVPYKALDSMIDALCRYLRRLPEAEARELLPREVGPLARVFPVLRRVEAVASAPRRGAETPDPQELRRRAFAGLRELLARLGDRHPLVLAIDDLQWADADSLAALSEVLRPPDPPALLLVACYRSEGEAANPRLRALLDPAAAGPDGPERRVLAVEPLTGDEARDLALALLGRSDEAARARAGAIAVESGGNPLFVAELVRAVQAEAAAPGAAAGAIALDEVLWARILRLPDDARRLLEAIAVSGRPIRPTLAWRGLGLRSDERSALALLRSGRLVRGTAQAEEEEVETYHDRVRETVVAHLGPEALRDHHGRLAHALEAAGRADPEVLGAHYQGAGEPVRAADHYALAAGRAAEALAFDRAATLYRLALELRTHERAEGARLRAALADALANAGRGADAAREYLGAAEGAAVAEAFELRRRAAMQFLISGHIDEGLATLRTVLQAVGMRLPRTPRHALASFLLGRAWLRLRGLGYRERDRTEIAAADLSRVDVCWSAGAGLSVVDWIRGADFQTRGLLLALRAGDPARIARALAMEAAHVATAGVGAAGRTAALLETAAALARRSDHPYTVGMIDLARGVSAYLEGRWRDALHGCDRAEASFRDRCTGVAWELDTAHSFALWALTHLGEIGELGRRYPVLLEEARERGDLYAAMNLSTYILSVASLADDEPEPARDELRRMRERWSREGYHVQHNDQLWAGVQVELYRGDGPSAWALLAAHWPALSRSLLLRVQFIRASMWSLRARAALASVASASSAAEAGALIRRAQGDARGLGRENLRWARAYARLIRGLLAAARGETAAGAGTLLEAAEQFDEAGMALCAAAARRRAGTLLGGEQGRELVEAADGWMARQAIRNPARMAAVYAPDIGR